MIDAGHIPHLCEKSHSYKSHENLWPGVLTLYSSVFTETVHVDKETHVHVHQKEVTLLQYCKEPLQPVRLPCFRPLAGETHRDNK